MYGQEVDDFMAIMDSLAKGDNHPERHKAWIWNTSDGNVRMVSCLTCGHKEPYNPSKHLNVDDID